MKRAAAADTNQRDPKRRKKNIPPFPAQPTHDLLTITDEEWNRADSYYSPNLIINFKNNKLKKDKNADEEHSFIQIEGNVIALANKRIEGRLGKGGTANVKLGQDRAGNNFAVKIEEGKLRNKNNEELQIMKKLNYYFGQTQRNYTKPVLFKNKMIRSKLYTVMQLKEGDELFDQVNQLTYTQKLIVAIKSCQAIQILHENNIIHGDMKSQNLMAKIAGNDIHIQIIDFGFSVIKPPKKSYKKLNVTRGTEGYIAPEIKAEKKYSFQSDIFALGKMFKRALNLPEDLYSNMIKEDPMDRCSLEDAIILLKTELNQQWGLDKHARLVLGQSIDPSWCDSWNYFRGCIKSLFTAPIGLIYPYLPTMGY